jgi:hypothetical protein
VRVESAMKVLVTVIAALVIVGFAAFGILTARHLPSPPDQRRRRRQQ